MSQDRGATDPAGLNRRRLEAIVEAQRAIALQGPDLQSVARTVLDRAQEILAADGAAVELREGDEMVCIAASGLAEGFMGLRLKVSGSLSGHCAFTGQLVAVEDTEQDPRIDLAATRRIGIRSMLLVPLMDSGQAHGVLKVVCARPRRFTEGDIRTLDIMGSLLASSIRRGMDYEILQRQQAELTRAKEAAENNTRLKSRFLADMSHEIRSPMNAVLGFAQLLMRDESLTAIQRDYVETILHSGGMLLSVVNDVLELSKIEAGVKSLNPVDVALQPLLEQVGKMFQSQLAEKPVVLRLDASEQTRRVLRLDAAKLRQILVNLLSNAAKFTTAGSITLRADAITDVDNPGRVSLRFQIEDTGCGISPEQQAGLFTEFVQADAGAQSGQGTGLGLSICRALVELMGGSIRLQSQPGQGTTVYFDIPAAIGEPAGCGPIAFSTRRWRLPDALTGTRAMVVDDEPDNRRLLMTLLSEAGFAAVGFENGHEALAADRHEQIDLILTDLHMQGLDGLELIRRLRARAGKPPFIIAISANILRSAARDAAEAGADAFLRKPFSDSDLFRCISTHPHLQLLEEPLAQHAAPHIDRVDTERLARLPEALKVQIRAAAEAADVERLEVLVERLETDDPQSAAVLATLIKALELPAIRDALS